MLLAEYNFNLKTEGLEWLLIITVILMLFNQGATKTVSTCPRQVILANGEVGCQSYLSFGQVDQQGV